MEAVTTFPCALAKASWMKCEVLGGRLEFHTIEAVRLFLQ